MKSFIRLFFFLQLLMISGCASQEVVNLGKSMAMNLIWAVPFVVLIMSVIFAMNKYILKNGRTNDMLCSWIGVITFPAIFAGGIGIKFSFTLWPMIISIILGAIVGWFSYTIDEILENCWENRMTTVPAALGLIMAGYMTTALFTHIWMEGDMYVTHKACISRAIVERYTYHYSTDKDGHDDSYYTWDYRGHTDKSAEGWTLPLLAEGKDYVLGTGALLKRDRVKWEAYYFIGGHFFSENKNAWDSFQWLRLSRMVPFEIGKVQRVQSDYFGNPFNNAGEVEIPKALPEKLVKVVLPGSNDVPGATVTTKVFGMTITAVQLMFTEEEYRDLLWIHLLLAGIVLALAAIPSLRRSVLIFVICASIVPLLIMMIVAARTGGIGELVGRQRSVSGGGGSFGGGGVSGRW